MASIDELIAAADAAVSGKSEKPPVSSKEYISKQGMAGIADTIGSVGDLPARLFQLGKVMPGMLGAPVLSAITGKPKSDFMPEVNIPATTMFSDYLKNAMGVDDAAKAPDSVSRYAGAAARGAGGSLLTGGGGSLRELLVNALKSGGVGGVAGIGAEGGGDAAEAMGGPRVAGQLLGGLAGGVGAASAGGLVGAATRIPNMMDQMQAAARDPKTIAQAEKAASSIVNARMRAAMEGTPNAAANIDDALALRARIPGFQPSVAEMAQAPAALEMQRVYARGSPRGLNEEVARVAASEQALKEHFNRIAPPAGQAGEVRSAVNQKLSNQLARLEAEAQGTAAQLPTADLLKLGTKASALAEAEKNAAKPAIEAAYQKAYALAPDSVIDAKPILSKIEEALGQPISQLKPETAPRTFDAIKRFIGGDTQTGMQAEMNALAGSQPAVKATMTLKEAAALRQAMNADARAASTSMDQLAATRARNIGEVRGIVDDVIAGSPIAQEAKDAFAAANKKYATEYVPRFKEGTNLQMFKDTSANEPRIIADKFIESYFKTDQMGGGTKAANFAQLFGKNAEAKALTKEGILDRFRNQVVNAETGTIDPRKAADFQRQYGRTLESFKANGVNAVDDIKQFTETAARQAQAAEKVQSLANRLKYENTDKMVDAALGSREVMGNIKFRLNEAERNTFTRKLMEKAMGANSGQPVTGDKINSFLDKNQATLKMILKPEHESALRDIAKGMQIIERSPVHGLAQGAGTDPLKAATGVSMATVWSQWRATSGGRQGVATAGFNLAAPVFTRLSQTKFDDVMKTALHDPKTAEALSAFLKAQTPAAATNWAGRLMDAAKTAGSMAWQSKGPIGEMALGLSNYPNNLKRTIPAINTEVQDDQ